MTVVIRAKAGEGGRLFGAITSKQVSEALAKEGIEVDKRKIELDEPIRTLGVTKVPIKLHPQVRATLSVQVRKNKVRMTGLQCSARSPDGPSASDAWHPMRHGMTGRRMHMTAWRRFDRVPPQNIEAEQAVLGSILLEADALVTAMERLRPRRLLPAGPPA